MHELKADRATINIFQPLDAFAQSQRRSQPKRFRGEQLVHVRFGKAEGFGLEVNDSEIAQVQRIDARFQMAEPAISLDHFLELCRRRQREDVVFVRGFFAVAYAEVTVRVDETFAVSWLDVLFAVLGRLLEVMSPFVR